MGSILPVLGMYRVEVKTQVEPSWRYFRIMAAVAEGVSDIEAVIRPQEKVFVICPSDLDLERVREIFGEWSRGVMRAISFLSRDERDELVVDATLTIKEVLAAHSVTHRT